MIETCGERGSGRSELAARQDDGDIYIYIYILGCMTTQSTYSPQTDEMATKS